MVTITDKVNHKLRGEDPGQHLAPLNPKQLLEQEHCLIVNNQFPNSIGCRMLFCGQMDILYASKKDLNKDLKSLAASNGFPTSVFGLAYDMKVVKSDLS